MPEPPGLRSFKKTRLRFFPLQAGVEKLATATLAGVQMLTIHGGVLNITEAEPSSDGLPGAQTREFAVQKTAAPGKPSRQTQPRTILWADGRRLALEHIWGKMWQPTSTRLSTLARRENIGEKAEPQLGANFGLLCRN